MLAAHFVSVLQTVSDKLMAGFVECLDNEEAEEGTEKGDGKRDLLWKSSTTFCVCSNSCFHTRTHSLSPQTSRLWTTEDDWKNPTWNPDPHPEPAHHLLGAEDTKSGPVPSGIWSEEACVLHQPPGPRSDHSFCRLHVNFAGCCDFSNIYWNQVTWVLSLSWRCICLLQVC